MRLAVCLCVVLLLVPAVPARAQAPAPESGRWQEMSFAADPVHAISEDRYIETVVALAAAGKLDDDALVLARVRAISAGLVRAAIAIKPQAADWPWEVHTSSDAGVEALCMAGGKILVGSAFVRQLALDDGELATLIGHEVAHALAEHQRETLSEALHLRGQAGLPLEVLDERLESDLSLQIKLSSLNYLQEREADQLGMVLAHDAGWPAPAMLRFYRKLAGVSGAPVVTGAYPMPDARISMAKGMLRLFATQP